MIHPIKARDLRSPKQPIGGGPFRGEIPDLNELDGIYTWLKSRGAPSSALHTAHDDTLDKVSL